MRFPFWLIPILVMAILAPLLSSKQKPWTEMNTKKGVERYARMYELGAIHPNPLK